MDSGGRLIWPGMTLEVHQPSEWPGPVTYRLTVLDGRTRTTYGPFGQDVWDDLCQNLAAVCGQVLDVYLAQVTVG